MSCDNGAFCHACGVALGLMRNRPCYCEKCRRELVTLERAFGRSRVLLPVVHTLSPVQVIAQVATAKACGADGVFLINQSMPSGQIVQMIPSLRTTFPGFWFGMNILGFKPAHVIREYGYLLDGVWSDYSGIDEYTGDDGIEETKRAIYETQWHGLWFGGVCFKYGPNADASPQRIRDILALSKVEAIDVVTTTGRATGDSARLSKVWAFEESLGTRPLALASGVTPENVERFPNVKAFLVATGIEQRFGTFDPARVRELAEKIHGEKS